jgi:uncharacterized protein (DUF433 family)
MTLGDLLDVSASRKGLSRPADGGGEGTKTVRSEQPRCRRSKLDLPPLTRGPDSVVRVTGTRVPLETLVTAFAGATAEEIAQQYPSVDLAAVYAVISYVLDHRREVDEYVTRRRGEAAQVRGEIEAKLSPAGVRARLLARRSSGPA